VQRNSVLLSRSSRTSNSPPPSVSASEPPPNLGRPEERRQRQQHKGRADQDGERPVDAFNKPVDKIVHQSRLGYPMSSQVAGFQQSTLTGSRSVKERNTVHFRPGLDHGDSLDEVIKYIQPNNRGRTPMVACGDVQAPGHFCPGARTPAVIDAL
jgi:hypothetical protein